MVALPSDVARGDERVKTAFETVFKAMVSLLDRDVKNPDTAMAIAALCVGGMVVARSMSDRSLANRLREAATSVALDLGGWTRRRQRESRPAKTRRPAARVH